MFSRTATSVCVLALPLLATATALPRGGKPPPSPPSSQCNTGSVQCCNSVQAPSSEGLVGELLGFLGIAVGSLTADVGVTCTPVTVIGNGNSCTQQTACCTGNSFSGLIVIGCSPININL